MTIGIATTDNMLLRVAKVQTFASGHPATSATGFSYLDEDFLYLITARHVVCDEAAQHHPEHLQVSLHASADDMTRSDDLLFPASAWYPLR